MSTKRGILFVLLGIVLLGSVLASYSHDDDDDSLTTNYAEGDIIAGTIVMDFTNEEAGNEFTSNFEGSITLLDLLEANNYDKNDDFTCSTPDCEVGYQRGSSTSTASLSGTPTAVGFSITGEGISVNNARLSITTSSAPSCTPHMVIDVLGNNDSVLASTQYTSTGCGVPNYGCFESGVTQEAAIQSSTEYCEHITLPPGPAFKIGGRIINSTTGATPLHMTLYDDEGYPLGSCTLPSHTQQTQELGCVVEYSSAVTQEYAVCISAESQPSNYKVRTETNNPCGNVDPESDTYLRDYELFGQQLTFNTGTTVINDTTFAKASQGITLTDYIHDYIQDEYDGSCSPECIIPIELTGSGSVTLNNGFIEYEDLGGVFSTTTVYALNREEARITGENLTLELSHAEFTIPLDTDEDQLEVFYDGDKIIDIDINISESFNFGITPLITGFGLPTTFRIEGVNVTRSTWDFGDDTPAQTVSSSTVTHQYFDQGTFEVEVQATRSDGLRATRRFNIVVGDPEEVANQTITAYRKRISTLETSIASQAVWVQNAIEQTIGLEEIRTSLDTLELRYNEAMNESEYRDIVLELIEIDVPLDIRTGAEGTFPLLVGYDAFNPAFIEEVSGEDVSDDAQLQASISGWIASNTQATIDYQQFLVTFSENEETLFSKFAIETKPTTSLEESSLIVGYPFEGVIFSQANGARGLVGGGTMVSLQRDTAGTNEVIEFIVLDDITPEELGAYISPSVSALGDFELTFAVCDLDDVCEAGETWRNCRSDCPRWGIFGWGMAIVLFGALVVYIILQEWYKRNYEKSLFKNENDLYNLVNFVYNARRTGLKDEEVVKNLKKAQWSNERIRFVMRKIDGKRTGMFEIPLFKFLENRKVKKEITKRQGGKPVDARFIKQKRF